METVTADAITNPHDQLADIVRRLEAATGPDRDLDAEIATAAGWTHDPMFPSGYYKQWRDPKNKWVSAQPAFTESIDAALTLVPEDHRWMVEVPGYADGVYWDGAGAFIDPPISSFVGWFKGFAPTPALAICIAALRARGLSPDAAVQEKD